MAEQGTVSSSFPRKQAVAMRDILEVDGRTSNYSPIIEDVGGSPQDPFYDHAWLIIRARESEGRLAKDRALQVLKESGYIIEPGQLTVSLIKSPPGVGR